ncbi:MAG: transcriptional regulator [Thermoprotei archaeon]|nr:MAG: transcriptional regulator [Thermoprotei archaeon]RLE99482.1 MAG: transcriptional regulator [Thermoprotei archaeon]HDI74546.1 transcriptional regulator [Thermoprotei archaeon]
MTKDRAIGVLLLLVSVAVMILYGWGLFLAEEWVSEFLIKITALIAVYAVFGILAWIGYTLATTPPPPSLEEVEKELEKEISEGEKEEKSKSQEKSE